MNDTQHIDYSEKVETRIITLCPRCRADYINSGYALKLTSNPIKSECDKCFVRSGFDYILTEKIKRR